MESLGMKAFGFLNVIVFIISLAKEILLLFLIYKGIKVLNIYIKKNNNVNKNNIGKEKEVDRDSLKDDIDNDTEDK
ncbi:hypothetical protein FYJ27_04635 [Anaerosalibacter bizertensis]|uniref:Uncharacterized protein n=1 Tax=Anaerosalibacter bizertensis TaxID=932217 RepID=A0A844FGD3_9FIRM|nr:hypothetical protein [Anaerosalibacter bizertensis]MBV1818811.1 hypothetical protein [Bacteroidales bacterium MSK.15.36]HHV26715.1 hypothetical protein [Tissierellia bacterium]MBU5292645.1 hypothetical protein [Anaerosalibacter bizertensis]MCB5559110.1 hypothetical protein [Anaerosalibacter bizertensis]MCG4565103.1 hypothetical protein [Anaerosalibacter bizertensis]